MIQRAVLIAAIALMASCGPRQGEAPPSPSEEVEIESVEQTPALPAPPAVDPALLAAANDAFTPIEPTEVGVHPAPTIQEALAGLLSPEADVEGGEVFLSTRESGEIAVADIVRTGLADDSVGASHLRFEFRREPEGWFPTNAYRRTQCRRGENAGQWSASLCP
ncbi:MAG: hypothetical protein AB7P07_03925 [Hyphomonadaceae bacterium]